MRLLAEKLEDQTSEDSKSVELIFHLIEYYKVDVEFLYEIKALIKDPDLCDEVINYILKKEQGFLDGKYKPKKLVHKVKDKILWCNDRSVYYLPYPNLLNKSLKF